MAGTDVDTIYNFLINAILSCWKHSLIIVLIFELDLASFVQRVLYELRLAFLYLIINKFMFKESSATNA